MKHVKENLEIILSPLEDKRVKAEESLKTTGHLQGGPPYLLLDPGNIKSTEGLSIYATGGPNAVTMLSQYVGECNA